MTPPTEELLQPGPEQRPVEEAPAITVPPTCHPKDLPPIVATNGQVQCPICDSKIAIKRYSRHIAPCVKAQRSPYDLSVWAALWKLREGPFSGIIARRGLYKLSEEQTAECCQTLGADPKKRNAEKVSVKPAQEGTKPRKKRKVCVSLWVKVVLNAMDDGADRAPQEIDGVQSSWKIGQLLKHLKNSAEETKDDLTLPGVTLSLLRLCEMDDAARASMQKDGELRTMENWRANEVDLETVGDVVAKGIGKSKKEPLVVVYVGVKRDPSLFTTPPVDCNGESVVDMHKPPVLTAPCKDDGEAITYRGTKDLSHITNWSQPPAQCVVTGRGEHLTKHMLVPEGLKGDARAEHLRAIGWDGDKDGPMMYISTDLLADMKKEGWFIVKKGKGAIRMKTQDTSLVDMIFTGIPYPVVSIVCDDIDASESLSPTKRGPADDDTVGKRGGKKGGAGGKDAMKAAAKEKDPPKAAPTRAKADQRAAVVARKVGGKKG